MNLDLLASIIVTACAAVAISVIAGGLGTNALARIRIAVALTAWFILVTILAAIGVLSYRPELGAPIVGVAVIIPIAIFLVTMLRSAWLNRALRAMPLALLIGVHVIRAPVGILFVTLYALGRLPAPFAPVAGWGDIIIGLAAVPVAWLAYSRGSAARPTILAWCFFGLADLISALGLGTTSAVGPLQLFFNEPGTSLLVTLPWVLIPGYLVPLMAWAHLAVFYRLTKTGPLVEELHPVAS